MKTEEQKKRHAEYLKNRDKIITRSHKHYWGNRQKITALAKARWESLSVEERQAKTQKNKTNCKEAIKAYSISYYQRNKERIKSKVVAWCGQNHDKLRMRMRQYEKDRKKNDINFRLICCLRQRISGCLARYKRGAKIDHQHTKELIGCSIEDLMVYLEKRFLTGMTWENYGIKGWHIDHITPCCQFNMLDSKQIKQCFHYTNMQPLWAFDNISKGGRLTP